jgi:hypothetical protein
VKTLRGRKEDREKRREIKKVESDREEAQWHWFAFGSVRCLLQVFFFGLSQFWTEAQNKQSQK